MTNPGSCRDRALVPGLTRLPLEILTKILEYSGDKSLLNLARVCHDFRDIAAAVLYRDICYAIHADDPIHTESSLDQFTTMVETVNISNYDYAQWVKDITVTHIAPYEADNRQGIIIRKPELSYEAGRQLNSLLTITVSKATNLTSFNWDIRQELTASVFRALSRVPDLRDLHIRLPPRTLAGTTDLVLGQMLQTPHFHFSEINPPSRGSRSAPGAEAQLLKDLAHLQLPPTISLMADLKSLSVLDIEDLKIVLQIPQCISKCSSTLKSLKLSFSDDLAKSARKRTLANTPGDSLTTDTSFLLNAQIVGQVIVPVGANPNPPLDPVIRRERSVQESVLAYIFKVDNPTQRTKILESALDSEHHSLAGNNPISEEVQDRKFVRALRSLSRVLPKMMVNNSEHTGIIGVLHKIDRATTQYLGRQSSKNASQATATDKAGTAASTSAPPRPSSSKLVSSVGGKAKKEACPSDVVNVEHPDVVEEDGKDQEFIDQTERSITEASVRAFARNPTPNRLRTLSDSSKGKQPIRNPPVVPEKPIADKALEQYVRQTHGISLESLSIHLIPVTATVISRAVDMFSLKHLSLLNVGPQGPLWILLKRFNQMRPLQLTSIHTDNVTPAFCTFIVSLDKVTELFLFERSSQAKVESLAAKTTVDFVTLRRGILTRHLRHLERFVIRNDEDSGWVADARTIRLISQLGRNLIELGIGVNNWSIHYLVEQIGGLLSLKALQVFWYRADMCTTTLREVQYTMIDSILHYPHLRIEYLALCYNMHGPIANAAIQIRSRIRHLARAVTREHVDETQPARPTLPEYIPLDGICTIEDNEGEPGYLFGLEINTRALLRIEDIRGVRMWEKGTWEIKL
ncbi:hypothetical protein BO94DRAFT_623831 [Aspergillus sclerotioniger CBS 115572]|uniref:F-box domain-containing protein n=1 Tax=Aspergillus sclerotioniger CBS 115572 TaxID=1450535 RepID=A0A317WV90_9EURO|nr:hypothetical protein BO94DRAFT_623831 [Aspergillus sclerotioniger CBS 115572]PWY88758.1 hypothetical protein BO94DRAFT_623831 [Aspergillus sclerotioniger CBS 115572]